MLSADTRPARWFLFAWVSLVYLVGWLAGGRLNLGHVAVAEVGGATRIVYGADPGAYRYVPLHPSPLFAIAMVIHYLLHVTALIDRWPPWPKAQANPTPWPKAQANPTPWPKAQANPTPRPRWAYFPLQAALLVVISANYLDMGLVIGLTLALCAEAPVLLNRPRPVMAAVACCGAGFAASTIWHDPVTVVWNTTDYLSMIMFVIGGALLLTVQRQAHTRQQRLNAELAAAAARIEQLTREAERRRIARDLHDTLSQGLVGVTMQLQAAIAHLDGGRHPRAAPILRGAVRRAQSTLAEARAAIRDLRTVTVPNEFAGPREVLQAAIDRLGPVLECAVDLRIDPALEEPGRAGDSLRAHLPLVARVAEEALANVARHARAHHASVTARQDNAMAVVEIRDDGIGLPLGSTGQAGGYGLVGMAERAQLAGGRLEVESAANSGTLIRLRLPADAGDAAAGDATPAQAPVTEGAASS